MRFNVTNPTHISPEMFDRIVIDRFQENEADDLVQAQAITLIVLLRGSKTQNHIIADILHAANKSRNNGPESIAEIGFAMGMQFGYELALPTRR